MTRLARALRKAETVPPEPRVLAAGPLGNVVTYTGTTLTARVGADANALVVLNRIAFPDTRTLKLEEAGKRALFGWACRSALGQDPGLVDAVSRRREHALRVLSTGPANPATPAREVHWLRLRLEPEWLLAAGHGNKANAYETGLALHGTYGWPVVPGSALKGLAAAWASSATSGVTAEDLRRVLGSPRPREPLTPGRPAAGGSSPAPVAARGTVRFLDAIPDGRPVKVLADVLTPHAKPYYEDLANGTPFPAPPAEYHNPVPVTFLTVRGGYAVDLYGTDEQDIGLAARWLEQAGEDLGAGAKTAAGYGYFAVTWAHRQGLS